MDFSNSYTTYDDIAYDLPIPNEIGFSNQINRFVSLYANGAYSFAHRYTFSASIRKDASNIFGLKTNDKWKPLWSVGGSWNIGAEKFYHWKPLPVLNLRLTYGYNGNVNTDYAAVPTIQYRPNPGFYSNLPYSFVINPANPGLQWEQQKILNVGIDWRIRSSILSGNIDFYVKKSSNLIASTPVDNTTGFTTLTKNVASLRTSGLDLQVNSINMKNTLRWETSLLFSYSRTLVVDYFNTSLTASNYVGSSLFVNPVKDRDVYGIYSYAWAGLDPVNGDPQGYLGKQISKNWRGIGNDSMQNLIYNGSAIPLITGALQNTIRYKGVSLSFNISFRLRYYFRKPTLRYSDLFNSWVGMAEYQYRWQKPGDEKWTSVPSMSYPANGSRDDFYSNSQVSIARADNIRLQDVRIGYDLAKVIHHFPFKQATVYVYASNVGILWKAAKTNLDPDYANGYLPVGRSYSLGLNVNF